MLQYAEAGSGRSLLQGGRRSEGYARVPTGRTEMGQRRVLKCLACKEPDKDARKPFLCGRCARALLNTNEVLVICERCTRADSVDFDTFDTAFGEAVRNAFPRGIPREPGWVMVALGCAACCPDGKNYKGVQMCKVPAESLPS